MLHNLLTIGAKRRGSTGSLRKSIGGFSMAYIEERTLPAEAGKKPKKVYRARIRIKGKPEVSDTFNSKSKAVAWAKKMEDSIRDGRLLPRKEDLERTFGDLIDRYIENELPKKPKSHAKQKMQLLWWKSHLGSYFLNHITPALIIEVRDKLFHGLSRRGKPRSTSTANRYLAALTHVYTIAMKEWGKYFENWLQRRGGGELKEEMHALAQVRHFFQQHGESRFSIWHDSEDEMQSQKTFNRAGFRKTFCKGGGYEYFVFKEVFENEICLGLDHLYVAKVCAINGYLIVDSENRTTRSERLPCHEKSTRVYRFTSKVMEE